MRILIALVASTLLFTSCATDQKRFDRMTEEELQAYNTGKPLAEQIYCYERKRTGSRIASRFCDSIIDIVSESARNAERIMVSQPSN